MNFVQPVEVHLYPDRLRTLRTRSTDAVEALPPPFTPAERVKRAQLSVEKGFRAQLRTGNLLTGQSYVAVDFFQRAQSEVRRLEITARDPRHPRHFRGPGATVASIVKKLDRVQYEQIGADVRKVLATLDQTLKDADGLVKRLDAETAPELNRALESARRTLKNAEVVLAAESPLQSDLREALRELTRAAEALRGLADLERHPEALIRGKSEGSRP